MKKYLLLIISVVIMVLGSTTVFAATSKTTCAETGCRASKTSGSVYCAKHAKQKIKKTKSMCSKADCYRSKEKGSNYCESHTPKKSTTVTTTQKTKSTTYKKYIYHDSYDDGWEDIYDNEDYDEERYKRDSDYANGVDDAMDEFDW